MKNRRPPPRPRVAPGRALDATLDRAIALSTVAALVLATGCTPKPQPNPNGQFNPNPTGQFDPNHPTPNPTAPTTVTPPIQPEPDPRPMPGGLALPSNYGPQAGVAQAPGSPAAGAAPPADQEQCKQ